MPIFRVPVKVTYVESHLINAETPEEATQKGIAHALRLAKYTSGDKAAEVVPHGLSNKIKNLRRPKAKDGVHIEHCCVDHHCKYADADCPVVSKEVAQNYVCEDCPGLGVYDFMSENADDDA